MLGTLFCFRGRMGRLKYFLWSSIFLPVIFFLMLLILPFIYVFALHFDTSRATILIMMVVPPLALFLWTHLSLQAARIRDIGWKPLVIIPAVLLINVADLIVAYFFPALALETQHFTAVSAVANAALTVALLFTPSADDDTFLAIDIPNISLPKFRKDVFRGTRSDAVTRVEPPRPSSSARRPVNARGQVSFGRRGLN